MKEVNALWHLNVPNKGPLNRLHPHLYYSLSPEQKQIVAVARRKLSFPAKTARGKLAGLSQNGQRKVGRAITTRNQRHMSLERSMLLANLGGLTFDRQKNHKNSWPALSSYIFFFLRIFPSVPRRYNRKVFCVNWIPRKINKSETQLSPLKHQHSL